MNLTDEQHDDSPRSYIKFTEFFDRLQSTRRSIGEIASLLDNEVTGDTRRSVLLLNVGLFGGQLDCR